MRFFTLFVFALLLSFVSADVYMHNPRGSNNRLNERSANRNNGDRLFDSQNNNRGGYNVGDRSANAFDTNLANGYKGPDFVYDLGNEVTSTNVQYQMVYYEGSELQIEWTSQHGCGGNDKSDPHQQNCDIVIQYMCQTTDGGLFSTAPANVVPGAESLRDGMNTNTPNEPNALNDTGVIQSNADRGHHESEAYYFECKSRSRNKGLFTADQVLNGASAKFTRQNPNGNRRGLECPEERDYYPYWSPTPWRDIVILTTEFERFCDNKTGLYTGPSQNNVRAYKCISTTNPTGAIQAITKEACTTAQGEWVGFMHGLPAPLCRAAPWSRPNHLGNGRFGEPNTFNWTLPWVDTLRASGVYMYDANNGGSFAKCVLRLRYNISTDDYDPYNTTSKNNHNPQAGIISPVTNNPTVNVGADLQGLRLAINTAQFGRVFEDRSHTFYIRSRPSNIPKSARIVNLNVRGKRGNIVQTFPSVEYDFVPSRVSVLPSDFIHVQWTRSNTHNNGDPAGDGQAGDAGEGRGGTDRHNMAQLLSFDENFPLPLDKFPDNIWTRSKCWFLNGTTLSTGPFTQSGSFTGNSGALDCAIYMTTAGLYNSLAEVQTAGNTLNTFDPLLDNAPASLVGGVILQINPNFGLTGTNVTYNYMCTRNNNFSNRSQKGAITVVRSSNFFPAPFPGTMN